MRFVSIKIPGNPKKSYTFGNIKPNQIFKLK